MSKEFNYQCSGAERCHHIERLSNRSGPVQKKELPFDLSKATKRNPKATNLLDESRIQDLPSYFKEAKSYNNPFVGGQQS